MAHRDPSPVHVPLRTSSANPRRPSSTMNANQEDMRYLERKASKASRILGTDLPVYSEHGGWEPPRNARRPSYIRTPDSTSRKNSIFSRSTQEAMAPAHHLRVRASSPLLGQDYRSHDAAPPPPKPSKKVHPSGSSSTLFSYFTSKESNPRPKTTEDPSLQPRVRHGLHAEPQVTYQHQPPRTPTKESKRKMRPSRIDLSLLFPKPRNPAPPLFSPQRMTKSPSPVSVTSDYPSTRPNMAASKPVPRLADAPPHRAKRTEASKQADNSDLASIAETKDGEWFEHPLERTVGTSEIDLALDRYAARRSLLSRSSVYSNSREQLRADRGRTLETLETGARPGPTHSPSVSSRRKDSYLGPNSRMDSVRQRLMTPPEEAYDKRSVKSSLTKKSSKTTLKNKDLQNSSVLCLSSSESEGEDDDHTPTAENHPVAANKQFRDSVATYGEFEPEIYTASTAHAMISPTLKRFERAPSTSSRGSAQIQPSQPSQSARRNTSMSSTGVASNTTRRTPSRQSNATQAVAQPAKPKHLTPQELRDMNRRSRVIAVTRQEQDLLEAMRVRKGKITPSIYNYNGDQPDRTSMISAAPSRDSFCGSDTSFLRLSAVLPPGLPPIYAGTQNQGATHSDKDGPSSQSSGSDTGQKTNSIVSPGFSMPYSESSLPSPATTSGTSPVTPTLPIHRFSPLPSPKPPPNHPPPAIPEDQKQHARRRTDSSEAIMLDSGDDPKHKQSLPLWSFDFDWNQNHDRASVAAVH
ncbi:hypothetical protein N7474_006424 [Penicillium riverlandense]|uniref:uncharacterized protein n=1 Tax=Penicillium riverlandense TaxID=1903569 RepID=UPI0025465A99|nr:uncharacterized protein N7474_006424 [Penicillium riverlandense]KAJ5814647.1 hypothetical protein N7474_006424 [Penicillium riverlandense]